MKKESASFFGVSYILAVTSLVIASIGLSNIFYFWIEDIYNLPVQYSFPFGKEYAVSTSVLLVMTIVFLACFAYVTRIYKNYPEYTNKPWRRNFLRTMFFISLSIFIIYVIGIFYGFFSGKSDFPALLKVFVMLFITSLGSGFFYFEEKSHIALSKLYISSVFIAVIGLSLSGVFITMHYAPPKIMQGINRDIELLKNIDSTVNNIEFYFRLKGYLPKNLSDIQNFNAWKSESSEKELNKIDYTLKNSQTFEMCATFESDPKSIYMRRLSSRGQMHDTVGKNCRTYHVKKESDGSIRVKLDVTHKTYDENY